MKMRRIAVAIVAAVLATGPNPPGAAADPMPLAAPLTFVDADGKSVSTADFAGKWLLIYFGYTHCVDQCPTGLSVLAESMAEPYQVAAKLFDALSRSGVSLSNVNNIGAYR